jgi:hypothetical protein
VCWGGLIHVVAGGGAGGGEGGGPLAADGGGVSVAEVGRVCRPMPEWRWSWLYQAKNAWQCARAASMEVKVGGIRAGT